MDPSLLAMLMQAAQQKKAGAAGFASGLFGDSGRPYERGREDLINFLNQGRIYEMPYYQAGLNNLPGYQNYVNNMSNPTEFINNLMGEYQESPYAKYQQKQAVRAAQNMGSASGLTGSTPLAQFMEQNAADISSRDMDQWLQNVLGINTEYGKGLDRLITGGERSGNTLADLTANFGRNIAEARYGREAGNQQDKNNMWGGLFNLFL